jgi:hypothetical protein
VHPDTPHQSSVTPSPEAINFGRLGVGQTATTIVTVQPKAGKSGRFALTTSCPYVKIEARERQTLGTETSFVVSFNGKAPIGVVNGQISVISKDDHDTILLPVVAEITESIIATPSVLVLFQDPSSPGVRQGTFLVTRPDRQPVGSLSNADIPAGFALDDLGCLSDLRRRFRVRVPEAVIAGSKQRDLLLTFSEESKPVGIRVLFQPDAASRTRLSTHPDPSFSPNSKN